MTAWGHYVTEVGEKDVPVLLGLDIVAFQFAEGGAMGYHGGVFFVTSDRKVYYTCYLMPSYYTGHAQCMSWDDLEKMFPPLKEFDHVIAHIGVVTPKGWEYTYLGMGNHLLIREDKWTDFQDASARLIEKYPDKILYNLWIEAILNGLKAGSES